MIGSLLYLTYSRPDIQFSVCLCAIFQASPRESHLTAVKRIFRSTKSLLCKKFSELMTKEFEMSLMGELNFFLDYR